MKSMIDRSRRSTRLLRLALVALAVACVAQVAAAKASLTAHRNVGGDTYNFWLYLPDDYEHRVGAVPLIVFLHGASLCGNNLNSVKRYGLIDAVEEGRRVDAVIVAPQCPGGGWKPERVHATVEWVKQNYPYDASRVYVVGMSLGGFGTVDYCATYPHEVAAGIGMCGGGTVSASRQQNLAKMPFWLIHGTADRAVRIAESKKVEANVLSAPEGGSRLRTTWLQGGNHGTPARVFYHSDTYKWLFSHSLNDSDRPVNRDIDFSVAKLRGAYNSMPRGVVAVENAHAGNIKKYTDAEFDSDDFDMAPYENITYDDIDFDSSDFVPAGFDDESSSGKSMLNEQGRRKISGNESTAKPQSSTKPVAETRSRTVTVRSGDTLDRIARRNGTTVDHLCKKNGISRTSTLRIGQKIKL